jgi:hypothetical protein
MRGEKRITLTSIKAEDLLATPTIHWKQMVRDDSPLNQYLGDFQEVAAGGPFPYKECPYPVSAGIYVALRWHAGKESTAGWGRDELNSLFRAFFWRNALSNRYDQGFLTQLGTDLSFLKELLGLRAKIGNVTEWAATVQKKLEDHMKDSPLPTEEELYDKLTDGRPGGALQKAFSLPMIASVKKDLVDPQISLVYGSGGELAELHHIYPRSWCQNNKVGPLAELLDEQRAGRDWVNSMANLMPLSRKSNNQWKAKNPGAILQERKVTYGQVRSIAQAVYIDEQCFDFLLSGGNGIPGFWERRARLIASDLLVKTKVTL